MLPRDTQRAAIDVQRDAYRRLGAAGRVELAFEMSEQAREISITGMLDRDPTLSRSEARARLLRRLFGEDLFEAAYARSRK